MDVDPSARTEAGMAETADGTAGASRPANGELVAGATVGKYRLDRVLGAGGMGVVWAAFDPDLERAVAIKVLRSVDSVATLRTRLLREARAMARLKHANVLTVYEVGTDRNRDYIAMELIDGGDLDVWLATKPLPDDVFAALLAAGRGLAAAHDAGLIHRDLKPHNILRGKDGGVYVTDFGLARGQIEEGIELVQTPVAATAVAIASGSHPRGLDSVLDSPLTQTGMLIGTPAYMSPEQFAGRAPDPRSDQFAFCVTAWEALTGTRPFVGKSLDELRIAASAGVQGGKELPAAVRAVLVRGLAPDAADRWPDMSALLAALEASLVPPAPKRSMRGRLLAIAPIAIAVVAGAALYAKMGSSSAKGAECASATEAFGSAWSAERRSAVMAKHRGAAEIIAVMAIVDSAKKDWFKNYERACAVKDEAMRHEQLSCLYEVRKEIDDQARDLLTEGADVSVMNVVSLSVSSAACKR